MSLRVEDGTPIPESTEGIPRRLGPEFIGPPSHSAHNLGIQFVHQQLDRLCWAACAEMVLSTFGKDVHKCRIASALFKRQCCQGLLGTCNRDCDIPDVGRIFRAFDIRVDFVSHQVSFDTIQNEIDNEQRPLELQISWGDGGHVLVVDGWRVRNQVRFVKIKDPWYGPGEVRLSDLMNGDYTADSGKWVGTWIGFSEV